MRRHTEMLIHFKDTGARILISWQAGDDYRAERLFRVAEFLNRNRALPPGLIRLHDHAGILRPCWLELPTNARVIRLLFEAWANEGEQLVWHMLGDDPRGAPFLEDEGKPSIDPSPMQRRKGDDNQKAADNWLAGPASS